MLDEILYLLINTVRDTVAKNIEIPIEKREHVVEVAVKTISDNFRKYLVADNLSYLKNLFLSQPDINGRLMVSNIKQSVADNLSTKVGLPSDIVNNITFSIVYTVLAAFSRKISSSNQQLHDIECIIHVFSGKNVRDTRVFDVVN